MPTNLQVTFQSIDVTWAIPVLFGTIMELPKHMALITFGERRIHLRACSSTCAWLCEVIPLQESANDAYKTQLGLLFILWT